MGTSRSNTGPISADWSKAKRRANLWAKGGGGTGGGQGLAAVVAGAIAALAGRTDGMLGGAGPAAGQRLGGLLSDLGQLPPEDALRQRGLDDLVGLTGVDLLLALLDYLAQDAEEGGLERNAVRVACEAVAEIIVDRLDETDPAWTEDDLSNVLVEYWTRYIGQQVFHGIADSIERASMAESQARADEIIDYIRESLLLHMTRHPVLEIDWTGPEGARLVTGIIDEVLTILGGDGS